MDQQASPEAQASQLVVLSGVFALGLGDSNYTARTFIERTAHEPRSCHGTVGVFVSVRCISRLRGGDLGSGAVLACLSRIALDPLLVQDVLRLARLPGYCAAALSPALSSCTIVALGFVSVSPPRADA